MNKMNKIINFAYFIMKDFSLMQLIIGLASLFIFLYRTVSSIMLFVSEFPNGNVQ